MKLILCDPKEAAIFGHQAAMVLSQIRYWRYKAFKGKSYFVVERFGEQFVVRSRSQLCEETGFSPKQLRCALETLKAHGYIKIEQHLFGGKNLSHFLVKQDGPLDWVSNAPTKTAQEGHPADDPQVQAGLAQKGQLLTLETNLKTKKEYSAPCAPPFSGKLIQEEEKKKKGLGLAGDKGPGASRGITPNKAYWKPSYKSTAAVADRFREAWEDTYAGELLPEFSAKELKQFKCLCDRSPLTIAGDVVDHCVRNWPEFCSYAKVSKAAYNLPDRPTIGPLENWLDCAINLYLDQADPKIKQAVMENFKASLGTVIY